jgi:selenocysteine-specific translation elongation factor
MPVDDAFALTVPGRMVVVGVVADGEVRPGDRLILRTAGALLPVTVEALEAHHKPLKAARRGEQVGIMLVGADIAQLRHGAVLVSAEDSQAEPGATADGGA